MIGVDASCLAGKRVLVVEDEFLIAMTYEYLLSNHGCIHIGTAPTVERALELIDCDVPEAVLLDANLNGTPSVAVAKALEARSVPFLLVTGYENLAQADPVLRRARRVLKPVTAPMLIRAMAETFC